RYSLICSAICCGLSSYSPKALGRPALGWAELAKGDFAAITSKWGTNGLAPRAQLKPTDKMGIWDTEIKKASAVCPERVLPEASVIVPETMMGKSVPRSSLICSRAKRAALALRVSN